MTKEERAAIRKMHSDFVAYECIVHGGSGANKNDGFYRDGHAEFIGFMTDGFPTLLDALDKADENLNTHIGFTAKEWHDKGVVVKEGLEKVLAECLIDRDRWKARADALERALRKYSLDCDTCVITIQGNNYCPGCYDNNSHYAKLWQFNEARFANAESDEPNQQKQ